LKEKYKKEPKEKLINLNLTPEEQEEIKKIEFEEKIIEDRKVIDKVLNDIENEELKKKKF